ncbi:MAG TPA: CsbD family protein [Nitrospiraceae bacterium]|nr:CsbD family protein [Nitrospiraceae bacterium]
MNADHFKGRWNQFKGELKKQWGAFTDDDLKKIEGDYEKFKGAIQVRYADRKDEINRWVDEWYRSVQTQSPAGEPGRK